MKKISIFSLLFLWHNFSFGQELKLVDIWHFQKGDFNKDSLQTFFKKKRINLKFNEIINFQFSNQVSDNQQFTYQYRIVNASDFTKWREIGNEAIVQLPNLEGGEYVLEISIKNLPKRIVYQLPIHIEQAFWQKLWVWVSVVVYVFFLIGIGVYFFSLYNLRQKLKLQDVRNRIAADLHDEVGSNLNSIAIFVEVLRKKSPPELKPILDKIINNSTESVQLMQDTIWAIQTKNDDFQKFTDKMKGFATEVLAAKNIVLVFENRIESSKNMLSMEQRKNAYLIFKEAINNVVKHSNATKTYVRIYMQENQIKIEVEDNGSGFDVNEIYEGNGLQNFEDRAEEHEMNIKIESKIDIGTKILLAISLE